MFQVWQWTSYLRSFSIKSFQKDNKVLRCLPFIYLSSWDPCIVLTSFSQFVPLYCGDFSSFYYDLSFSVVIFSVWQISKWGDTEPSPFPSLPKYLKYKDKNKSIADFIYHVKGYSSLVTHKRRIEKGKANTTFEFRWTKEKWSKVIRVYTPLWESQ